MSTEPWNNIVIIIIILLLLFILTEKVNKHFQSRKSTNLKLESLILAPAGSSAL